MTGRTHSYLRTDYLQPGDSLPEIDPKQSPLVLLAQTCSQIGKDSSSTRTFSSASCLVDQSVSSKPTDQPRSKTSGISCTSAISSVSKLPPRPELPLDLKAVNLQKRSKSPPSSSSPPVKKLKVSSAPHQNEEKRSVKNEIEPTAPSSDGQKTGGSTEEASGKQKQQTSMYNNSNNVPRTSGFVSLPTTTPLTSSHQLIPGLYDPLMCHGCQMPHAPGTACLDKNMSSLFSLQSYYLQMMMAASRRDMASMPPATTPSTESHVCNWNVGSSSCGKSFPTADELLVHLRSHTTAAAPPAPSTTSPHHYMMPGIDKLAAANPYAYLQQATAMAAMSPAHNQLAASLMVRSTSPLSRYGPNPYKAPVSNIFNPLSLPVTAGVGPYCPPFALYPQHNFSYH